MNPDFWIKKWQDGETRFHQSQYHPALERFGSKFEPGTILVPLCGKTLDMLYFTSKGHKVVGVELSPIACKDFFKENNLSYQEKKSGEFVIYESEKISLWCGDFFHLPQNVWNCVNGLYDRAALVALPPEMRQKYAKEITLKTPEGTKILLVSYEYPDNTVEGPPFSVKENEIKQLYSQFEMTKVHSEKETKYTKDHPTLKSIELIENIYWLSKK